MSDTLSNLVQRTITRLSMVPGVAVQVYAEDRLAEMIWHKFVMVRDELWWDDLMMYNTLTQDANGRPGEHVVRFLPPVVLGDEIVIASFSDIQYIWTPSNPYPLKDMPNRANPAGVLVPGRTMFKLPDQAKVFRVAPFENGRKITVRSKISFNQFMPDDVVPMDDQLLILGAAYDYLEDDGTNSGQTEKFRNMFNDRLRQLKSSENEREIPLSPVAMHSSSSYQEV